MENIKLYINANTEDVKNYLEKLIDVINKKYPKFDEIYLKMINTKHMNNYWNIIFDKLNFFSNLILNKNKNNNIFISTILFLLFGNYNTYNKNNFTSISLEQYENSLYSCEILNFRNCLIIILIQIFINYENNEQNSINFINNKDIDNNLNINNNNYLINSINKIIKSSYIKKSIHVIKSLLKKNIDNENIIFILSLFYFIYKKYKKLFIEFINTDNCDIKKEYKNILINEYQLFTYKENDIINYSNKIFEIKLSYSLLGLNPKNDKINKFLETIKDKKLKGELLEVYENYYYKNYLIRNNNNKDNLDENKNNKLLNILKEVQIIKKNIKEVKNSIEELKNIQNNCMDDIFRVLNIINKQ